MTRLTQRWPLTVTFLAFVACETIVVAIAGMR